MAKLRIARAQQTRRRFLGVAGAAAIAPLAVPGAAADARYSFRLSLYNVHNGEDVDAVFWEEGRFLPQAVERFEQLLRDWRTGDIGRFDPRLLLQLSNMAAIMGTGEPFHVVSAFRSAATNLALHLKDAEGVPVRSYHMYGRAIDIRLPGVPTPLLRDVAEYVADGSGGVGYYPGGDFVHIDTGRIPRRW